MNARDSGDLNENYLIRNFFGFGLEEELAPEIKDFIAQILFTTCLPQGLIRDLFNHS